MIGLMMIHSIGNNIKIIIGGVRLVSHRQNMFRINPRPSLFKYKKFKLQLNNDILDRKKTFYHREQRNLNIVKGKVQLV